MISSYQTFISHITPHLKNLQIPHQNTLIDYTTINILPAPPRETPQGWHICNLQYTITLYIENLHRNHLSLIACLIYAFHQNIPNQTNHNLPPPTCDITDLEDQHITAEFTIPTNDEIHLTPDPQGPINIGNHHYTTAHHTIQTATQSTISQQ